MRQMDVELGGVVGRHRALQRAHRHRVEELATLQERRVQLARFAHQSRLEQTLLRRDFLQQLRHKRVQLLKFILACRFC